MASRLITAEEREHRPARSATPAAWMALALLAVFVAGWIFFDAIVCGAIRLGLAAVAWNQNAQLSIDHLSLSNKGIIQAQGIAVSFGSYDHRSSWKSDSVKVRLPSLARLIGISKNIEGRMIQEIVLGKTSLLLDRRGEALAPNTAVRRNFSYMLPWMNFLPASCTAGPVDLIVIGENFRVSATDLAFSLPDRWAGKVWYSEAVLDVGSVHQIFPAASASSSWNGSTLRLGPLALAKELKVEELTLSPHEDRMEFGIRGTVGEGLLRGDGAVSFSGNSRSLDATLVGENLKLEALSMLAKQDQHATGTIRQGRFTFRGNPSHPLEADSSLRLVADAFRWEGRGWDSLRVAATLTGRVLTLSELSLHQKENEVEAEGESKLPEDWHAALKAPFTASFHAVLEDAGALAALAGPDFAQLSGRLVLEGTIKGGENKAEGYCNLLGTDMMVRNLPVDWLKGCLLFEGATTHLSYLEAWSGDDRMDMEGTVENSRPHTYSATAEFGVENLTRRLAQLGVSTAAQIGGGAVQGTWQGDGSTKGHSGSFQAKVTKWISPWTTAGMSGSFEGTYSPSHLYCSKAEFQQDDLKLNLQLSASPTRLEAKSIVATRHGKSDPVVQGDFSLPVNAPALWETGDLVSNLGMGDPLALHLALHNIKAEELADLLGQHIPATGALEGDLTASGTPQNPEIHSTMKVARLTLPDSSIVMGLTGSFNSSGGRATCELVQEPVTNSPLILQAEFPFRLSADKGTLHISDSAAVVHAKATLHGVSLNGWVSLWGEPSGLRDGTLDGSLKLDGTLDEPSVEGSLLVNVGAMDLPGLPQLSAIRLPISCSLSKATAAGGTAFYCGKAVTLSGALDWQNKPWEGHLDFLGKDLTFPKVSELESHGDAAVTLRLQGINHPQLTGNLMVKSISGSFLSTITPFFSPPGFVLKSQATLFQPNSASAAWQHIHLDLHAKTEGALSLTGMLGSDPAILQADLHLQGEMNEPHWRGKLMAENSMVELPSGRFIVPEATLENDDAGQMQLSFTAFGLTRLGFCILQHEGSIDSAPWFETLGATHDVTAADVVLALATPVVPGANRALGSQVEAWIRQNMLFPVAPVCWITKNEGSNEQGSLGFYGNPWNMSFHQAEPASPTLPEHQDTTKN